jgi:hypothetical protein
METTPFSTGAKYLKFCMIIQYRRIYRLCINLFYKFFFTPGLVIRMFRPHSWLSSSLLHISFAMHFISRGLLGMRVPSVLWGNSFHFSLLSFIFSSMKKKVPSSVLLHPFLILDLYARGSVVGWGTMLQAGRSPVRVPDKVDFFQFT